MATCANCGHEHTGNARFCEQCGEPLASVCSSCRSDLSPDARFCAACGTPVTSAGPSTLAGGFSSLHLGSGERERILSDVEGEHRLVTAVFADMTSSVKRTAALHPEDAVRLVNRLLEAMVETLVRYGGRIDRFLGDGLLAVFGIPDAHEDDPIRAVRAALEIRDRGVELELGVTVGINTGRVYFGPIGSSLHEELTVMGPVVNLAARLQGKAAEGQVLVGSATHEHVRAAFHLTETLADIKGIDEPVAAYVAERILDHPDKVRGVEGLAAALVGRDAELERLTTAAHSPGAIIGIVGDAGVGKSRLVAEFHRSFVEGGGFWLEGRCLELTRGLAYAPIRDLLERHTGGLEKLQASVDHLIGTGHLTSGWASEVGPFLFHLLAEGAPDPKVTGADAEQRKRLTSTAVTEYLSAVAAGRPTVVFIDDLHWSDGLSIDLLSASWSAQPTLLAAYRPEQGSPVDEFSDHLPALERIGLSELSEEDSRTLLRSLLHIDGLPESVESLILTAAEGNPFYVEEIIRSFIQQGLVVHESGVWRAKADISNVAVPDSVQAVVMSRVDRLGRKVRRCAQVASVLGRAFTRPLLELMAGDDVTEDLAMLRRAGLIERERLEPVEEYSFLHALTHQGVYETLLPSRRSDLHERAGFAFETLAPHAHEDLAYHFARSRNHTKAVEYLTLAARAASDAYLTDTSFALLEQGIARAHELAADDEPGAMARLLALRGELAERQLRHGDALADLQRALELVDHAPLEEARLYRLIGLAHRQHDRYDEAHAAYDAAEQALARSPEHDSTPFLQAWIDIQKERSFALYFGGRGGELPIHNAVVEPVITEHGSPAQQMDHLVSQALSEFRAKHFAVGNEAISYASRALAIAEATGNLALIAETRFMTGFALLWGDRPQEAEPALSGALAESARIGDVMLQNRVGAYHAISLRRLGRVEAAWDAAMVARDLALSADDDYYTGHSEANLAWAAWRRGDVEDARAHGEAAYEAWGSSSQTDGLDVEFSFLAVWPMVAISLDSGDHDQVRRHLRYLKAPWERTMPPDLQREVDAALAEAWPRSEPHARRALELAQRYHLA